MWIRHQHGGIPVFLSIKSTLLDQHIDNLMYWLLYSIVMRRDVRKFVPQYLNGKLLGITGLRYHVAEIPYGSFNSVQKDATDQRLHKIVFSLVVRVSLPSTNTICIVGEAVERSFPLGLLLLYASPKVLHLTPVQCVGASGHALVTVCI